MKERVLGIRLPVVKILCCTALLSSGCAIIHEKGLVHSAISDQKKSATLADLPKTQLPTTNNQVKVDKNTDIADVIKSYRRVLAQTPNDHPTRPAIIERLADYYLINSDKQLADDAWDESAKSAKTAAELYDQLALNSSFNNQALLYKSAKAWDYAGKPSTSVERLSLLVQQFPQDTLAAESWFRVGEHQFSKQKYADAIKSYQHASANADSRFSYQSRYKLGWSYYMIGQSTQALITFRDLIETHKEQRGSEQLLNNAYRASSVVAAAERNGLNPNQEQDSLSKLLIKLPQDRAVHYYTALARYYEERNELKPAADVLIDFARSKPHFSESPMLSKQAIEWYQQLGDAKTARDEALWYVSQFGPGSSRWPKPSRAPEWKAFTQSLMENLSDYYHALSQQQSTPDVVSQADRLYVSYLAYFPDSPKFADFTRRRGELLADANRYDQAIEHLERSAYGSNKGSSEQRSDWAYLALETRSLKRQAATNAAEKQLDSDIEASARFVKTFRRHPKQPVIALNALELALNQRSLPKIVELSDLALAQSLNEAQKTLALTSKANALFDLKDYSGAAKTYALAGAGRNQTPELIASQSEAEYQLAKLAIKKQDFVSATHHLSKAEQLNPTGDVGRAALNDRIALHATQKQWDLTARALLTKQQRFGLDKNDWLLLAEAQTNHGSKEQAAKTYEQIANMDTFDADTRKESMLTAAKYYEQTGDVSASVASLAAATQHFPMPLLKRLENYQHLIGLAQKQRDADSVERWRKQMIAAWNQSRNEHSTQGQAMVAQAQYDIAITEIEKFKRIKLKQPLQTSIENKKLTMEQARKALMATARFGEPYTVAMATWSTGELYQMMAQDILTSQRPSGLDEDAKEEYELILEEQAIPFEDKAIEAHQVNIERAWKGEWTKGIAASFAAMSKLNPARYDKSERWE